jgi:glycosyltransferase involved in cell wall biosynthesis
MRALNRKNPGSCRVITLRAGVTAEDTADEVLCYPKDDGSHFRLPRQLKEDILANVHGLDGLVLHGTYNPMTVAMKRLAVKAGIPYIFIPHDPYPPALRRHHALRKWVFWHLFERGLIEGAQAVQLLDSSHERHLRELGCTTPVEVIPNGCETQNLSRLPETAVVPGAGKAVRILYLGRMDRNHKGLDLLIEGFALWAGSAAADAGEVSLVMTGKDWEDRDELAELARRRGVGGQTVFTGELKEHSMEILGEADVVVLASRFDGFGLCIVEAMLAGRPVLVSREAGVASHVERAGAGWLIEPNAESIREGISLAIRQKEQWAEMGARGRQYVLGQLTWAHAAERSMEIYRRHFMKP